MRPLTTRRSRARLDARRHAAAVVEQPQRVADAAARWQRHDDAVLARREAAARAQLAVQHADRLNRVARALRLPRGEGGGGGRRRESGGGASGDGGPACAASGEGGTAAAVEGAPPAGRRGRRRAPPSAAACAAARLPPVLGVEQRGDARRPPRAPTCRPPPRAARVVLVQPVRRAAVLGVPVHLGGAHLHLSHQLGAHAHLRVQRLVPVGLGVCT